MINEQTLLEAFEKGMQIEFKPFLRTFTILPPEDGFISVMDTDGDFSKGNNFQQVLKFVESKGQIENLNEFA